MRNLFNEKALSLKSSFSKRVKAIVPQIQQKLKLLRETKESNETNEQSTNKDSSIINSLKPESPRFGYWTINDQLMYREKVKQI